MKKTKGKAKSKKEKEKSELDGPKQKCSKCGAEFTCPAHAQFCSANAQCDQCGVETNPDELEANGGMCDECLHE